MLSKAKHLAFSSGYEVEILRLSPQNDTATQSQAGEARGGGVEALRTRSKEFLIKKSSELCDLCGEITAFVAAMPRCVSVVNTPSK